MKLPSEWKFDHRPVCDFADADGVALEVRHVAGNYYRAEFLVKDADAATTKRSWTDGVWCHRATRQEAIDAVEQLATEAGIVERRSP
jgi:hypothetical protein